MVWQAPNGRMDGARTSDRCCQWGVSGDWGASLLVGTLSRPWLPLTAAPGLERRARDEMIRSRGEMIRGRARKSLQPRGFTHLFTAQPVCLLTYTCRNKSPDMSACAFTAGKCLIATSLNLRSHWAASCSGLFHMEDNKIKAGKLRETTKVCLVSGGWGKKEPQCEAIYLWCKETCEFTFQHVGQTLPLLQQSCPVLLQGDGVTALTDHPLHLWLERHKYDSRGLN